MKNIRKQSTFNSVKVVGEFVIHELKRTIRNAATKIITLQKSDLEKYSN